MSVRRDDEATVLICDCCGLTVQVVGGIVSAQEVRWRAERGPDKWVSGRRRHFVWDLCGACRAPGHGPADHATPTNPVVLIPQQPSTLSSYHELRDGDDSCHYVKRARPHLQEMLLGIAERLGYGRCSFCGEESAEGP